MHSETQTQSATASNSAAAILPPKNKPTFAVAPSSSLNRENRFDPRLNATITANTAASGHFTKIRHLAIATLAFYLSSYAIYRNTHTEVWDRDGRTYIMFAADAKLSHAFFLPLLTIDSAITGVKSQLGEHPKPAPADTGVIMRMN